MRWSGFAVNLARKAFQIAMPKKSRTAAGLRIDGLRPTIRDVAKAAGVSTATVSHVLSGARAVRPARQKQVLEAIESLGYSPNWAAASLRVRRSSVIGIVVPDVTSTFFGTLIREVEELAAVSNYQILLADTQEDPDRERERVRALIRRRPDGLIVVPCRDHTRTLEDIRRSDIPTVIVDRVEKETEFDSVSVGNFESTREGCRHLISLGHRRITLLVSEPGLRNIAERIGGYREALAEAGLGRLEAITVAGTNSAERGCQALRPNLAAPSRPTAIFALTDYLALGALRAIWEAGLSVPNQISLLAFDDCEWMTGLRPFLSAVRQPVHQIASEAWSTLKNRLEGKPMARLRHVLPCSLIIRESTAAV